ncbi:MAG TPA: hypothetical protein VHW00_16510 [Thermoanaerobaculia bacterium]|nr:hypothetical protein [Thermoanaerobaculia bacterium]
MSILLQAVLLLCAGYALWRLWRLTDSIPPLLRYLIAGGFLIRAFAAQVLFWISYLELPLGRSLQIGYGLWFYAVDAVKYLGPAVRAANEGLPAIFAVAPSNPSVIFIRVLALFLWLFGWSVFVGTLLNVTVYLCMSLLIVRWAARYNVSPVVTAIPLFAIGYLPTWILWALQPLKDAFFCFLIVLFAFAVDRFVAAWKRPAGERAWSIVGSAFLVIFTFYLLAGVRWYYAAVALGTAGIVSLSILFVRRGPRELAVRAGVLFGLALLSSQVFVFAGGPYIPKSIAATLQPWKDRGVARAGVSGVVQVVQDSRDNLDRYRSAGTMIKSGRRIADEEKKPAAPATSSAAPAPVVKKPPAAATTTTATPLVVTTQPAVTTSSSAPKTTTAAVATKTTVPPVATKTPVPAAAKPALPSPAKPTTQTPAPAALPTFSDEAPQEAVLPQTPKDRLLTGAAALLLPRWLAVKLELVSIGGGRGLMWFAELDTILFDLVLLAVIAVVVASLRRGAWRDPFVWYLLLVTSVISGAIAYTISNYGTLVRHRGMLMATAVLLAIAVRRCVAERREAVREENAAMLAPQSEMPLP